MNRIIPAVLFLLVTACAGLNTGSAHSNPLNGTWKPVKQEMGGKILPENYYHDQKLILKDSIYTLVAESLDKGIVKLNGGKMDIFGKEGVNAGKHFKAIYKFENGELTVCYNLAGDNYPETFDTKEHSMFFLSVFQKDLSE